MTTRWINRSETQPAFAEAENTMSRYLVALFVAIILLSVFAAIPAKADSVVDTFVFQTCEGPVPSTCGYVAPSFNNTYTWQSSPSTGTSSCDSHGYVCYSFDINADVTANGTDRGLQAIVFGANMSEGGFEIPALNIYTFGLQLVSGLPSSPTFNLGTYSMTDPYAFPLGTLTISNATGVPEPSVLLQTGAGLLLALAVIAFWRKEPSSTTCS